MDLPPPEAARAEAAAPARRERGLRRFAAMAGLEVAVAAFAAWALLRLLGASVRWIRRGSPELEAAWAEGRPVLLAFWHGRSIMLPFAYRGRGACIMNSTHRDGEIVSRVLARFGIACTRGSSTRGAVGGLVGLLHAHRRGLDLALIPDGPRGPAGVAKAGAVELAMLTGAPLFPLGVSCSSGVRMRSWDRLLLPLPFARMALVVGEPLRAPAFEGAAAGRGRWRAETREAMREELERRLRDVTAEADRVAGRRSEPC